MNIILLSGGSGKRLWPLSNDVRSKQFLKIFKLEDGTRESMLMRMYRMIKSVDMNANITIASSENQVPQIRSQLCKDIDISVEPSRKDTFLAIVLAATYLKYKGVNDNEPIVVCPVDPYVTFDYFKCLKEMSVIAGEANLTLMGIEPSYPSTKYGYIIPSNNNHISKVLEFKEKPNESTASSYIKQGALWNGGVFAFKLSYLLGIARERLGTDDYMEIYNNYSSFEATSFDYAVVEKEKSINVLRFSGEWKDLGTWNTLSEAMSDPSSGNVTSNNCDNTCIINELRIPMIALGIKNAVIVATPDGILITDKTMSPQLKDYVEDSLPKYERKDWGEYRILDYQLYNNGHNSIIKELIIDIGKHVEYESQEFQSKIWMITEGSGVITINNKKQYVNCGDIFIIKQSDKYSIDTVFEQLHIMDVEVGVY